MDPMNGEPALVVRVRDGRFGRHPTLADERYGELLMTYVSPVLLEVGDLVTLVDGSTWPVVGAEEHFSNGRLSQDVTIGEK